MLPDNKRAAQSASHNPIDANFDVFINWQDATLRKISINLAGHSTSFSLENPFLDILKSEARLRQIPFAQLVRIIDDQRPTNINLSSALRLVALAILKNKSNYTINI
ncbi:ribbon-helix-helix domain-containing protein [Bartonella sp. HY761]|uniref:ribbon-helix-helix domain-containing protein n=1 Tax=Bartonella sp. HY761 TaxID=2979330 RepID=UPI002DDDA64D|nr:ribbon-helix-helix domain-containing protein [Bartonella sp. HY761]